MCIMCGWGLLPYFALSSGNASHEHTHVEPSRNGSRAIEILKERYAQGEITKETYFEMRKDIEI